MLIQTHYILQFLGKAWILTQLEALHAVRFQAVSAPYSGHRRGTHFNYRSQGSGTPVGGRDRSRLRGETDDLVKGRRLDANRSPRAWPILQTIHAFGREPLSPAAHGLSAQAHFFGDLLIVQADRRSYYDSRPLHQTHRQGPAARESLQIVLLLLAQPHLGRLS